MDQPDIVKRNIEDRLDSYLEEIDKLYSLTETSPSIFAGIKAIIYGGGKRLRPVLLVMGYQAFADEPSDNIYNAALALELLHNFVLIHDDIVDRADSRRGNPSLHTMLGALLKSKGLSQPTGEDLAIIAGDVVYAAAIHSFLNTGFDVEKRQLGVMELSEIAVFTGIGQLKELLDQTRSLGDMTREEIDRVYDLKTAKYSFCGPLRVGAILAGASEEALAKLDEYGIYMGRAFQIKDDILDIVGEGGGDASFDDIKQGTRTLLAWHSYLHSSENDRQFIQNLLNSHNPSQEDIYRIREMMRETGALKLAASEVTRLAALADETLDSLGIDSQRKQILGDYCRALVKMDKSVIA